MRRFSTVMVLAAFLLILKTTIVQAVANEVRLGGINRYDAPILLTEKQEIPSNILNEIKRLKAKNVYIIGGTGVVDINVENMLKNIGINVIRIAGKDRFATNLAVITEFMDDLDYSNVFIATGSDYPELGEQNLFQKDI